MYEAGSAVYLLTGRVDPDPFARYARLVQGARAEKEHRVVLGADTQSAGFDRFVRNLVVVRDEGIKTATSIDKSTANMTAYTNRLAVATSRDAQRVVVSYGEMSRAAKGARDSMAEADAAAAGGGGGSRGRGFMAAAGDESAKAAGKSTRAWKDGFNTLAGLGKWVSLGIVGLGAVSVKAAADFQKQMELVHTQAGYSQKQVEHLKKSVLDLAPAVGIGPTKLAEGLFHIASAGIPASKAMNVLTVAAKGARIGNSNLEDTTNALVAILRTAPKDIHGATQAMGLMIKVVGEGNMRMQDLVGALSTGILPAAKAVGLGFKDVGAALDVMTSRGVPAQEGATRLRTVLGLIANPTAKAQKALDELGFSHDRLAKDFREKGLVGALQDLRGNMDRVFGHKLTIDQERQALQAYGQQLVASGASATTVTKALTQYKHQLDETGAGAIKSSQLIASAFGGARMGTTMQILMQNIGDVRKHFNDLNKDNAAKTLQDSWAATEKTFSEQAAKMWAGIQKLAITLGTMLIPKLEAVVTWLGKAAHWLGQHKTLADALAIAFGVTLTAAIVAFFARFLGRIASGIAGIGKFGEAIFKLPSAIDKVTEKVVARLRQQQEEFAKTADAAAGLNGEVAAGGAGGVTRGGGGGLVGALEGEGSILGLITGVRNAEAPGSMINPLAVMVVAGEPLGMMPGAGGTLAAGEKAAPGLAGVRGAGSRTAAITEGGILIPSEATRKGGSLVGDLAAGGPATVAEEQALATLGIVPRGKAALGSVAKVIGGAGSRLLRGAGTAGIGLIGAQIAGQATGSKTVADVGTYAALGAGIGSAIEPGLGTAIGAGLGAIGAGLVHLLGGDGKTYGQQVTGNLTRGFGTPQMRSQAASLLDQAAALNHPTQRVQRQVGRFITTQTIPGLETEAQKAKAEQEQFQAGQDIAKALEAGWKQYKFQDEPTLFGQFKTEVKGLPPAAQAAAADSAIKFAQGLEKHGRLTKGSTTTLIDGIKRQFPGLVKYLGLQGDASAKTFTKALDFTRLNHSLQQQLTQIGNHFAGVREDMIKAGSDIHDKSSVAVKDLLALSKYGTGPMKAQASQDLKALRASVKENLEASDAIVQGKAADMKKALSNDSSTAQQNVKKSFDSLLSNIQQDMKDGSIAVSTGTALINRVLKQELDVLGIKLPKGLQLNPQSVEIASERAASGAGQGGIGNRKAGGGMLPGSEFGMSDMMTLIDPTGAPRAKLAGDEAIFTRHQMPWVEAGLQMMGFAGAHDLWRKVDTPHYMAKGGDLARFAGGGNVGQAISKAASYVFPFSGSGWAWSRTDQGVDFGGNAPVGAIGNATVTYSNPSDGWYPPAPAFMVYRLDNGPMAGKFIYVSEHITKMAPRGAKIPAGHAVAEMVGGIETGWAAGPSGHQIIQPHGADHLTQAGQDFHNFLTGLAHGHIVGGNVAGGSVGVSWKDIHAPHVDGRGLLAQLAQGALGRVAGASNRFGRSNLPSSGSGVGLASTSTVRVGPGGWVRVGATIDPTMGQPSAGSGPHGGMSFAELLVAGANAGLRSQDIAATLGLPNGTYGMPEGSTILVRAVGGKNAYRIWKNDVGSGQAGDPFYKVDLHQKIADLLHFGGKGSIEIHRARGGQLGKFAKGGWLGNFQSGGQPWPSLPSGVGHIPGYRPVHERRGRGGVRVVGTGGTHGRSGRGTSGGSRSSSTKPKQKSRTKQPITLTQAQLLDKMGLGTFVSDQNKLGQLDNQYTQQESLFQTFDAGGSGMPLGDLNTLMGIREQEWDILYKEYKDLPAAIAKLQTRQDKEQGVLPPRRKGTDDPYLLDSQRGSELSHTSVNFITKEVNSIEHEITNLQTDVTQLTRKSATARHKATAAAMGVADQYAGALAQLLDNQTAIHNARFSITQQRTTLNGQLSQLSSKKSSPTTLAGIINKVMGGGGTSLGTSSTSSADTAARKAIHRKLTALRIQDNKLGTAAYAVSHQTRIVHQQITAARARYRKEGFDTAWDFQQKKWKIQDKINILKATLTKLKAKLKDEGKQLATTTSTLQQLENWSTGGLQGTQSIAQSLEDTAMNILDLYQQGANLPTPNRKSPTLDTIEKFLISQGLTIPAGLTQGAAGAAAGDAAFADLQSFLGANAQLFSSYGSNFVPVGGAAMPGYAGMLAGFNTYGAASGPGPGVAMAGGGMLRNNEGPGGTTVNIHNNFAAGPPDPLIWASGVSHEFRALV